MICKKCGTELSDEMIFCWKCGRKQIQEKRTRQRGNGEGTVYKLPNGNYKAVVVKYYMGEDGKKHKKTRSKECKLKKDAVAALDTLKKTKGKKPKTGITFKALYDLWLPTHRAGKDTIGNYKAAIKYFEDVWFTPMEDIDIDDLQECVDECPRGKRTKENMKAVCGLVYKYGIPRHAVPENLNLAPFLIVSGEGPAQRASFTDVEIEKIRRSIGTVEYADYIYCMIYLGFRPSEFLRLDLSRYDAKEKCFVGGGKTKAGTDRPVTISPKIQGYVEAIIGDRTTGAVFCDENGDFFDRRYFTEEKFYTALEQCGIVNPMVEIAGGMQRHKYTPHSCRHTFATLMKRIQGNDKDKLALIGHTSDEMLRYYQDVRLDDLRKITDVI